MTYENLLIDIQDRIATITINRPKAMNALNAQVLVELIKCFREIRHNSDVGAIMITGSGDKAFVAGADIVSMQNMTALDAQKFVRIGHRCMKAIESTSKPVVAAINGYAFGGGLELALSCDFIYASKTALLGLPEVNLGLYPGFGGTQRLARLIGKNKAKEIIFTAKNLTAEEALQLGIVNKVVEPDQLLTEVKKTLGLIIKKGPIAVGLAKRVINEGTDLDLHSGLMLEESTFPIIFATEDKKEGVNAFLEKRKPNFTGK